MNTYARVERPEQPRSAVRRWAGAVSVTLAVAALALGACGSPATEADPSQSPTPTVSATATPPGSPAPQPPGQGASGEGQGSEDNPGPEADPLLIEVITSPPTASYPCHPAGSIMVSGGSGGDSTQVGDGPEYPVDITYQWFIRKQGPDAGAPVPYGMPGALQFTVAGGIPVSAPELTPATGIEVELRVVSPENISGGWVAYPGCVSG